MKNILFALLLLPQIAWSQTPVETKKKDGIELSFQAGYAPDNASGKSRGAAAICAQP